jgi:hypothetical protein
VESLDFVTRTYLAPDLHATAACPELGPAAPLPVASIFGNHRSSRPGLAKAFPHRAGPRRPPRRLEAVRQILGTYDHSMQGGDRLKLTPNYDVDRPLDAKKQQKSAPPFS